jgi:CcmD family protein
MYDFLEKNAMYIVLLIAMIIWVGLFFYMFRLDSRIKKLEKEKNTE